MLNRLVTAGLLALAVLAPPAAAQQNAGISPCALPGLSPTTTLSVTNSGSTNVKLSTCGNTLIVYNITSQEAFYRLGSASNTAATTSDWSLPGNTYVVLNVPTSGYYLAAITSSSTTTFRLVQGGAH